MRSPDSPKFYGGVVTLNAVPAICSMSTVTKAICEPSAETWLEKARQSQYSSPTRRAIVTGTRDRHPEPPDVLLFIEVADTTAAADRLVKVVLECAGGHRRVVAPRSQRSAHRGLSRAGRRRVWRRSCVRGRRLGATTVLRHGAQPHRARPGDGPMG